MQNHCQDCTYKFVECSNEGCDVSLPPGEMDHHASACPHRVVSCDYCGESVKFCHLDEHYQSCAQYPVECERCQTMMERSKVPEHDPALTCSISGHGPTLHVQSVYVYVSWGLEAGIGYSYRLCSCIGLWGRQHHILMHSMLAPWLVFGLLHKNSGRNATLPYPPSICTGFIDYNYLSQYI